MLTVVLFLICMCFMWSFFSKPRDTQVTTVECERCPVWLVADLTGTAFGKAMQRSLAQREG